MSAAESQMSLFAGTPSAGTEQRLERSRRLAMILDHRAWLDFIADEWWPLSKDESVRLWIDRPRIVVERKDRVTVVAWIDRQKLPNTDVFVRRTSGWSSIQLSEVSPTDDELMWPGPIPLFAVTHFSVETDADSKRILAMAKGFSNVGAPTQRIAVEALGLDDDTPVRLPNVESDLPKWSAVLRPPLHWNAARGAAAMAAWAVPAMEPWVAALCETLSFEPDSAQFAHVAAPWWISPPWVTTSESTHRGSDGSELWRSMIDVVFETEIRTGWRPVEVLEKTVRHAIERGVNRSRLDDLLRETSSILADERSVSIARAKVDAVGLALQLVLLRPSPDRYIEWERDLPGLPPGVLWMGATIVGGLTGYKDLEPRFRGTTDARCRLALRTWQLMMARSTPHAWTTFVSAPSYRREAGIIRLLWDGAVWGERLENDRGWWLHANLAHADTRRIALEIAQTHGERCIKRSIHLADAELTFHGGTVLQSSEHKVSVTGSSIVDLPDNAILVSDLDDEAFKRWLIVGGIEKKLPVPADATKALLASSLSVASEPIADPIPGLRMSPDFVSDDEERDLMTEIDHAAWSNELSRKVQHYGWRYRYKEKTVSPEDRLEPLPRWADKLARRLLDHGFVDELPDQVIVNEYIGKQGISKHVDCVPCFRGAIATISLLESWEMNFWSPEGNKISRVLERRSVAVMSGPAREQWMHEIPSRKSEPWGERGRRVSLTFRRVDPLLIAVKNAERRASSTKKSFVDENPRVESTTTHPAVAGPSESSGTAGRFTAAVTPGPRGANVASKKRGEGTVAVVVTDVQDPRQLDALAKRLLAFAHRFAGIKLRWLGEAGALANGQTVEDVVRTALVSLYGGKRRWDRAKYPDPWVCLMLFVKAELLNLSVSNENRLSGRDVDGDALITSEGPEDLLLQAHEDAARPERIARAYSLLIDELGDDARLLQLHDLIINEDIHKPQQLAERLGMSVKDVNNLKRRFWSACKRVLAALEKERTDD